MKVRLYIKVLYSPFACDTDILVGFRAKKSCEIITIVVESLLPVVITQRQGMSMLRGNCCSSVYALFLYVRQFEIKNVIDNRRVDQITLRATVLR